MHKKILDITGNTNNVDKLIKKLKKKRVFVTQYEARIIINQSKSIDEKDIRQQANNLSITY